MNEEKDLKMGKEARDASIPEWKIEMFRKFLDRSVFGSNGAFSFASSTKEDPAIVSKDVKSALVKSSTLENSNSEVKYNLLIEILNISLSIIRYQVLDQFYAELRLFMENLFCKRTLGLCCKLM